MMKNIDTSTATTPARHRQVTLSAALISLMVALLCALPFRSWGQEMWHDMTIPMYPGATDVTSSIDDEEYEIYFQSQDDTRAVYDFYREYLEEQGFKVTKTKTKKRGFKADMARGDGGPNDRIELDVKQKHDRIKVEIEFDD